MYRQDDDFTNHDGLRMTSDVRQRKQVLAGLTILFISLGLIVTLGVSAHDIDTEQARQKLEPYARSVITERNYRADAISTMDCAKVYPHQVRCYIKYQTEQDFKAQRITCDEGITIYFKSHNGSKRDWTYYTAHVNSKKCGRQYLSGPNP